MSLFISDTAHDWLTLACLNGIGNVTLCRLAQRFEHAASILSEAACSPDIHPRLTRILSDQQQYLEACRRAKVLLDRLERDKVSLVCSDDPVYPQQLKALADPPVFLFYRGELSTLQQPVVAVIGSRAATSYGREVSSQLAAELARRGIVVVSGVARGIDGQAHHGAIAAGGLTAGVLGCGVDVIYPREHEKLYRAIAENGILLSEYPCGTRPDGFRFPARNRIISGLALGVVIVEADLKSGSLITARLALDQGREVFAVPGRIDSEKSRGTHSLLRQGACLVETADDIVEELGLLATFDTDTAGNDAVPPVTGAEEQCILDCLDVYPVDIDSIRRVTGLEMGKTLDLLLKLELKGLVRQHPGQLYEKVAIR